MKHISLNLILPLALAALALPVSCGEDAPDPTGPDGGRVTVEFVLGAPATRTVFSDESVVDHWSVFVFKGDGTLETHGVSSSSAGIQKSLLPGVTYHVWAVVNAPSGFDPGSVTTESGLRSLASALGDNSSRLVMFGGGTSYSFQGGSRQETVPVTRLACKIGLQQVTVNMTDPYYAAQTFVLKGVWVSNVYTASTLGSDHTAQQVSSSAQSAWLNRMGSPSWDAVTGINRTIAQGGSYSPSGCYFYAYPNATPAASDTHDSPWSPRCTRLVINASIGGVDYYYQVTVPAMARNNSYVVSSATITKPGSRDPEEITDGAIDVVFSTETDGWDGPVNVGEES